MNGHGEQNRIFVLKRLAGAPAVRLILLFVLVLLALLWFAPQLAFSLATPGNGPGGVGTTNGSSTLELWLRADRGVFSDSGCTTPAANGNNAGCWQDQSGNGANANQTISGNQPVYTTGSVNGQPVLTFAGNQVLNSGSVTLSELTVFVVFNASNAGIVYEHNDRVGGGPGSNLFTSDICTVTVNRAGLESTKTLSPNWGTGGINRIVTQAIDGTHSGHTLSINNLSQAMTNCFAANDPGSSSLASNVYIGAQANVACCGLQGNIAELIFFNENLPTVQKILIENYLSSKYGITLGANDYFDGDTNANGDFDLDVAGIGRFGGVSHAEAQAAGMVVVNGTFLNADGDWLLFGHNTVTNGNTTADLPAGGDWDGVNDQRWLRSFYFDRTDAGTAGGTVDLIFDFSDGGMTGSPAGTATNYRLLTRAGATGTFAEIAGACVTGGTSIAGDRVTFSGVDVTCLGSNFTLGTIDVVNSPTAVSLESTAIATQPSGLLVIAACVLTLGLGSFWICLRNRPE